MLASLSFLLHTVTAVWAVVFDPDECPVGWKPVADRCIKPFPQAATISQATKICRANSGALVNVFDGDDINKEMIDDISDLLNRLFVSGLNEPVWMTASIQDNLSQGISYNLWQRTNEMFGIPRHAALRRTSNRTYELTLLPSTSPLSFPFLCSLDTLNRRILLYRQAFLPVGTPSIVEHPMSNYLYTSRDDNSYVMLPCKASGKPLPIIRWFKSGVEEVNVSLANSSLQIVGGSLLIPVGSSTTIKDIAYASYHCSANNHLGTVRSLTTMIRPAFISSFEETRMDVFPLNYPSGGARIECEAPAHYPPTQSYSWMRDDQTSRFIPQDDRIFISRDGTLYFSYILQEDATSYACSLALTSTQSGHYGPFFNLRLSNKISESAFRPKIDELQPQIFPARPVIGETAYLECFAYGRPSPKYHWQRADGRALPLNSKVIDYGRGLRIDSLEWEDAGRYMCTAQNELGVDSAEVLLYIYAVPVILTPLHDQLISINASVVFTCHVSVSDATVEWFHNAVPISPILLNTMDRSRISIEQERLKIQLAVSEDSGIYQCIATNDIGSATSSARLTVIDIAPKFEGNIMPRKVYAVIGSDVTVPCIYHASPMGQVIWYRQRGDPITVIGRIRYRQDPVKSLVIDSIEEGDQGKYVCAVANHLGTAEFTVHILVMEKPNVSVSPQLEYISREDDSVKISCEVEMACGKPKECPEALFDWTFNDRPIKYLRQYRNIRARIEEKYGGSDSHNTTRLKQTMELKLPQTLGSHRIGRFSCTSLYGGGTSDVNLRPGPPSPIELTVLEVGAKSAKVLWKRPYLPNHELHAAEEVVDGYRIEFRTKESQYWKQLVDISNVNSSSMLTFDLEKLQPNQMYQFRIRSVGGLSLSRPSRSTGWIRTRPSAPSEVISSLRWRTLDRSRLFVEWERVETNHLSGPNLRYRLSWSEGSDSNEKSVTLTEPNYVVKITNAQCECCLIVLSVIAFNDIGYGPENTSAVAHLSANAPTRRVGNITTKVINSTSVKFGWKWIEKSECENFFGTLISCWTTSNDTPVSYSNESIPAEISEWILSGLLPHSSYMCVLTAFDQHGHYGTSSEQLQMVTELAAPSRAPTIKTWNLLRMADGYSTKLEWTAIDLGEEPAEGSDDLRGYKIKIFVSLTSNAPVVLRVNLHDLPSPSRPAVQIDGLKLMHYYTVQICGYNRGGDGPLSLPYSIRLGSSTINTSKACDMNKSLRFLVILFILGHFMFIAR
ncbi:hypothetical protein AB6A40_002211 [Gnathostoma spinigerum]|uniref:Uncharacterized protein n=1 Tax=Gnathostoma spinigerum TaxID=75299 RepID=A0ABD6EG24_9BILA